VSGRKSKESDQLYVCRVDAFPILTEVVPGLGVSSDSVSITNGRDVPGGEETSKKTEWRASQRDFSPLTNAGTTMLQRHAANPPGVLQSLDEVVVEEVSELLHDDDPRRGDEEGDLRGNATGREETMRGRLSDFQIRMKQWKNEMGGSRTMVNKGAVGRGSE
jgi:hypothetical protein